MTQGATQTEQQASRVPGGTAEKPTQVPAKGWLQIAKRGWAEAKTDNVPLLAAGMAYYAFLAIFPALIAAVLIYALVADPAQIAEQVNNLGSALPAEIRQTITDQITVAEGRGAGWGAVVAILLALFSASGGVGNMMTAINTAYDEEETRGFVKKRAIALALTLGAIVFLLLVVGLVAVLPGVLQVIGGTSTAVTVLIQVVRWVIIVVVIAVALAVM